VTDDPKTTDWHAVLEYLKPKLPSYCPEKPSVQQQVFLRTNAIEALFGGAAGGGKLENIFNAIPTPSGFKKMVDIRPGDFIFGADGKPHLVLAESDIEFVPGYKLIFDDGASVIAHDQHLWVTFDAKEMAAITRRDPAFRAARRAKRPSRAKHSQGEYKSLAVAERNAKNPPAIKPAPAGTVRSTAEIVATLTTGGRQSNHAIQVAKPIDLPRRDLLVDPYVLGIWLGDGSTGSGTITSMDQEIVNAVEAAGYPVSSFHKKENNQAANWCHSGLRKHLRLLGVLKNKHIPHDYLWASEEQRVALLQGLMDTDGTVAKGSGSAEFCNTNKNLAEGVAHLARSLGMKATVREGRAKLNGKDCGPKWTVKFVANRKVFRLDRKASLQKIATRRTTRFRYIVAAERVEVQPMKCIRVSSPDSLYLTSEHFIPTHNSSALLMAALQYVDIPNYSAVLFRRTLADLTLPGALMDRFRDWIGQYDDIRWNSNTMQATFPSGARIAFGYLNNKEDYLRYKGMEAQFIGMDEVTEIRESDYRYLFSRLRRPSSGPLSRVPLRMRCASNPAPNWVRQRFIVEGREYGRVFVSSTLTDNPGIDAVSYRRSLQELDPVERRRLEEGDWWVTSLGSMFKREDFLIIDGLEVPDMVGKSSRLVRFWDFAATEPSPGNTDPDWTVGTLMLFDEGIAYVLDVRRARVRPDKVEQLVAQTAREDGPYVGIRFEIEPGSAGKMVADQLARFVVPGYDVMGIRATGDKEVRARPFASAVANGLVRVVRASWLTEWLDEFSSFPEACSHDDQVDSAVGAYSYLAGLGLPQRRRAVIIV
jgi:predicted phage terminase large subunit-like protein